MRTVTLAVCGLVGTTAGCALFDDGSDILPPPGYAQPAMAEEGRLTPVPAAPPLTPVPADTAPRIRSQKPDDVKPDPAADAQTAVRPVAFVNTQPIFDNELREATFQRLPELMALPDSERAARQKEISRAELDRLIERELILEDAFAKLGKARKTVMDELKDAAAKEFDKVIRDFKKKNGIKSDEELKAAMAQTGLTMDGMRRQMERRFISQEYIRNLIFPKVQRIGLNETREYYDQHQEEFRVEDSVKWQDLFVDASSFSSRDAARQAAEQIAAQARAGADFVALVKQYDQGDSRFRDGTGLGEKRGEIRPDAAEPLLFAMRPGEVGPLIELSSGFHVIRLTERTYAGIRPFNEAVQAEVRKKVANLIAEREYKRVVDNLRKRATIRIVEEP